MFWHEGCRYVDAMADNIATWRNWTNSPKTN